MGTPIAQRFEEKFNSESAALTSGGSFEDLVMVLANEFSVGIALLEYRVELMEQALTKAGLEVPQIPQEVVDQAFD